MELIVFLETSPVTKGFPVQFAAKPAKDKSATKWIFGSPYRRIRNDNQGYYINTNGKRKSVVIGSCLLYKGE